VSSMDNLARLRLHENKPLAESDMARL
jgi:hypothetical protein